MWGREIVLCLQGVLGSIMQLVLSLAPRKKVGVGGDECFNCLKINEAQNNTGRY